MGLKPRIKDKWNDRMLYRIYNREYERRLENDLD